MFLSRRDLYNFLPPSLLSRAAPGDEGHIPSKVYVFDQLEVRRTPVVEYRQIVEGKTVDGCKFSVHESALQPGHEPHPPHHHTGEEMFLMIDGALDVTINGKTSRVAKGGIAFIGSGDEHGIRNPGPALAKYYVVEIGQQR